MKALKNLLILSLVNFGILIFAVLQLPEIVPIHVNYLMEVDRYGSKWFLLAMGSLPMVVILLLFLRIGSSRSEKSLVRGENRESILFSVLISFLIILTWVFVFVAQSHDLAVSKLMMPLDSILLFLIGLFIIIVSNFMSGIQQNFILGIRTPWTLKSEAVWKKTHRLGGYTGVFAGIVMCVCATMALVLHERVLSLVGLVVGVVFFAMIPSIYSYAIYQRESSKELHP